MLDLGFRPNPRRPPRGTPPMHDTVLDCLGCGIYSGIESGMKSLFKNSADGSSPFQYEDLTMMPAKSGPTSKFTTSFRCLRESCVNTKTFSWDSKVNEKIGFSCSLECFGSGFIDS